MQSARLRWPPLTVTSPAIVVVVTTSAPSTVTSPSITQSSDHAGRAGGNVEAGGDCLRRERAGAAVDGGGGVGIVEVVEVVEVVGVVGVVRVVGGQGGRGGRGGRSRGRGAGGAGRGRRRRRRVVVVVGTVVVVVVGLVVVGWMRDGGGSLAVRVPSAPVAGIGRRFERRGEAEEQYQWKDPTLRRVKPIPPSEARKYAVERLAYPQAPFLDGSLGLPRAPFAAGPRRPARRGPPCSADAALLLAAPGSGGEA